MSEVNRPQVTVDVILNFAKEKVEKREVDLDPKFWMDIGLKLAILLPDEVAKLYDLQREVAKQRLDMFEAQEKRNVSEVKMRMEATEVYRDMRKQEAKIEQVEEIIRISKLRARIDAGQ